MSGYASSGQPAAAPAALSTFIDLLACPVCRAAVVPHGSALQCVACRRCYRVLPESDVPVLLPSETFEDERGGAREVKAHVLDRFALIDRVLPDPYGWFATFLNLGYVANDAPQFAVREPGPPVFNRFSAKLLFEVLGDCDLDGRVVFELGAGRGGNIASIQRSYRPLTLVGMDLSTANVEFCQRRHAIEHGGFVVGDVEHLPFRDRAAEVVVNLESSHYYPNLLRFFDEVHRILGPGGQLLYADVLPARTFETVAAHVLKLGFAITRDQDISENVLLSCLAIAELRAASSRHAALYETFTVVPGSAEFEALRTRATPYKIFTLLKP